MHYLLPAVGFCVAFILAYFIRPKRAASFDEKSHEEQLKKNERAAQQLVNEAKKEAERLRKNLAEEQDEWAKRLKHMQEIVEKKEETAQRRLEWKNDVEKVAHALENDIRIMREQEKQIHQREQEELLKRLKISKEQLIKELRQKEYERASELHETRLRSYEEMLREHATQIAKDILRMAIDRYGDTALVEGRSPVVPVTNDLAKGRLIGAEGKNIQMLEELTGVDVVFDDAPETITLSAFDLVKREVAKTAIQMLLKERNITPERVKETVEKAEKDVEAEVMAVGKKVLKFIGVTDKPDSLAYIVGRLKFRTSYGQNVLKHSIEIAYMARMIAEQIGADARTTFLAGFFHDLGKAVDHERNQPHDILSRDLLREYGFPEPLVHAAWTHHETEPPKTPEAKIVRAADAISASRPGARQESLEQYIERIRELEGIAASHDGVKKTYAISAGREIRVIVDPGKVPDEKLFPLARGIADDIQTQLSFPGKIKVNVIRRTEEIAQTL